MRDLIRYAHRNGVVAGYLLFLPVALLGVDEHPVRLVIYAVMLIPVLGLRRSFAGVSRRGTRCSTPPTRRVSPSLTWTFRSEPCRLACLLSSALSRPVACEGAISGRGRKPEVRG